VKSLFVAIAGYGIMGLRISLVLFVAFLWTVLCWEQSCAASAARVYLTQSESKELQSDASKNYKVRASAESKADLGDVTVTGSDSSSEKQKLEELKFEPTGSGPQLDLPQDLLDKTLQSNARKIEATIINPFRSAAIAA